MTREEQGKEVITEIIDVDDMTEKEFGQAYTSSKGGSQGARLGMRDMINLVFGGVWSFEGYLVKTNKQTIAIGISNQESCCESWGHIQSDDDLSEFIGAELLEITKTDTALNTTMAKQVDGLYLDEGGLMFITFKTNKGQFQLAVYNEHNGYYGHTAFIVSNQLHETDVL